MKNKCLKVAAVLAMSLFAMPNINAQQKVTLKNDNGNKFMITMPEGQKYDFIKDGSNYQIMPTLQKTTRADESYTVKFKGIARKGAKVDKVVIFNKDVYMYNTFGVLKEVSISNVPAGTYDAVVTFKDINEFYVFKEGIEIKENTSLEFNMEEAVNAITYKYYDENNKELYIEERDLEGDVTRVGTAKHMAKITKIVHKDYGPSPVSLLSFGAMITDHDMEFYVNDLSDKYCIVQGAQIMANGTFYNVGNVVTDIKTQTVANNSSNLRNLKSKFHFSSFMLDDKKAHTPGCEINLFYQGINLVSLSTGSFEPAEDGITTMWMDMPKAQPGAYHDFTSTVRPWCSDSYTEEDYYGEIETTYHYIKGYQVSNGEDGGIRYNYGGFDTDAYGFNRAEGGEQVQLFPEHPEYSFDAPVSHVVEYGNSSSLLSFKTIEYIDGEKIQMFKPVYVGRFGETNETYEQYGNGEFEEAADGVIIKMNTDLMLVDGEKGGNEAEVYYKNDGDDTVAPTLQMLTFKDKDGNISQKFDTKEGARMLVSGGDFDLHVVTDNEYWPGYYTCKEADFKTWLSKTGAGEWQELNPVVVPEKYQWPGFGYFYDVNLGNAQIDGGWYDVKTLITDKSGNYQTQIIKRAFYVGNGESGIHDTEVNANEIVFAGSTVNAFGAQQINVYTTAGELVASANAEKLSVENLNNGVYVATAHMADGSRLVKKIIVR